MECGFYSSAGEVRLSPPVTCTAAIFCVERREQNMAKMSSIGWNDIEAFVSLMQKHPKMYDQSHRLYNVYMRKTLIWHQVASKIYPAWADLSKP